MAVAFEEMAGSPTESYGKDGFQATRKFLVAWDDRHAFVRQVAGFGDVGGGGPVQYPGFANVVAVNARITPFTDDVVSQALASLTEGLNSYSKAVVTVPYEYVNLADDNAEGIELQEHTYLTHRETGGIKGTVHKLEHFRFQGDSTDSPDPDEYFIHRIPTIDHHYVWHHVRRPPWTAIKNHIGKVNSATWPTGGMGARAGYDAETLLFDGYDATETFARVGDGSEIEVLTTITYHMKELRIQLPGGGVGGWNHQYKTKKGERGYTRVLDENGQTVYQLTALGFDELFKYVS